MLRLASVGRKASGWNRGTRAISSLWALALLGLTLSSTGQAAVVDRVAAVVNDDVVTLSEIYEVGGQFIIQRCGQQISLDETYVRCSTEAELEVLDSLILKVLVEQELEQLNLEVTTQEVDRAIDQIIQDNQIGDPAMLRRQVEASGLTWQGYRDTLQQQIQQMKFSESIIRPRVSVSDDELRDLYNRTARSLLSKPRRKLEALAISLPEGADPIQRRQVYELAARLGTEVNAGDRDWHETIQTWDSGSFAPRKGDMGEPMAEDALLEIMREPVFAVDVGQVTEPVEIGQAVFLIRVVEELAGSDVMSFEDASGNLRNQLYEQKMQEEVEQWYQQTRRRSAVRILLTE